MKNNISLISKFGIFSLSLLATVSAVYMYSPVIKTHADSDSSTNVTLTIPSQLSFSVDDEDVFYMVADADSFVSGTAHFTVSTNSQYGYSLLLEDADDNTSLKNRSVVSSSEITSSFTGAKTSSTMTANTWGYSLNSTDFQAIPVFGSADRIRYVPTFPSSNSEMVTDVDFGVKVGRVSKSGYYGDVLLATAVVNGIDGLPDYTMQNFECPMVVPDFMYDADAGTYNEISERTYHLRDTRNGRVYEVVATKDGKCWMAENLDLVNYNLTYNDSNIPQYDNNADPYQLPDSTGSWAFSYNNGDVYEEEGYGTYYNANASTAGVVTSTYNPSNINKSICPKGWHLPAGYEWRSLFSAYGLELSYMSYADKDDVMSLPIKLGMTGAYTGDGVTGLDITGAWWTNDAYTIGNAQNKRAVVYLGDEGAKLDGGDNRDGYSVRCVHYAVEYGNDIGDSIPYNDGGYEI